MSSPNEQHPHTYSSPSKRKPFKGVSLCPNYVTEKVKYPFRIFCDCRKVINICDPGVYVILPFDKASDSKQDSDFKGTDVRTSERKVFSYVRVFPAEAIPIRHPETGRIGVQWGNEFFGHTSRGCDLIIATNKIPADRLEKFQPLEYRPTNNIDRNVFL